MANDEKTKTVKFDSESIGEVPKDKPLVYKLLNKNGDNVYTGVAQRGRAEDRFKEHLPGGSDPIPGVTKVKIQQKSSIDEARDSEARIIARSKPRHNKQGK
jgi:hypothetical protein